MQLPFECLLSFSLFCLVIETNRWHGEIRCLRKKRHLITVGTTHLKFPNTCLTVRFGNLGKRMHIKTRRTHRKIVIFACLCNKSRQTILVLAHTKEMLSRQNGTIEIGACPQRTEFLIIKMDGPRDGCTCDVVFADYIKPGHAWWRSKAQCLLLHFRRSFRHRRATSHQCNHHSDQDNWKPIKPMASLCSHFNILSPGRLIRPRNRCQCFGRSRMAFLSEPSTSTLWVSTSRSSLSA